MELTIKNLENCFNSALENNAKYFGIKMQVEGNSWFEIVISENQNFNHKLNHCKENYNEELTNKDNEKIKITGFTFGNSFNDIEKDLI